MQVELFGCTSAGKTTLTDDLLQSSHQLGMELKSGDDVILEYARMSWVRNGLLRTLLLDFLALAACLVAWRSSSRFCTFSARVIAHLPIPLLGKLNLLRNVLKRIGTRELVGHCSTDEQIVLIDGGTLHAAHHLFVHASAPVNADELRMFATLVPLPDVAVYVAQSEAVLIERTARRGHRRVPRQDKAAIALFIQQAVAVFDTLVEQLVLQERVRLITDQLTLLVAGGFGGAPSERSAIEMIRGRVSALAARQAPQQ